MTTQQVVDEWMTTLREFPPKQATASFIIDRMMQQMRQMRDNAPPTS
jgi:hypothetical protein